MSTVHKTYRSWDEYLDAASALPPGSSSTGKADDEARKWAGTRSIGDALKIARTGWQDGARLVGEVALPIVDKITRTREEPGAWGWEVTGADYDVGEYLRGSPECWLTPETPRQTRVITIMANVTTSCGIPTRMIELRGAAVVALALSLQASGFIVRVYKCEGYPVGYKGTLAFHRALLTDDQGGPTDTDRLLFALAHPAAARQIGYCLGSILGGGKPGDSLGVPSNPDLKAAGWECDVYLPAAQWRDANWNDEASVSKWVEGQYEAITGELLKK